jgi:CDP-paratose 2-epimerase
VNTILITGGAGFIGSNLAIFLKQRLKNVKIVCLDNLIRRGSELNQKRLKDHGIFFVKGDIRDQRKLLRLPKISTLIECSAEPSVLASYSEPKYTIDTNLIGTIHCLELAKRDKANVIFLSTSRVYPVKAINDIPFREMASRFEWTKRNGAGFSYKGINETFPLNGIKSLYGASKLSSEQIFCEYLDMYGLKGVINRFGVIAGPWQMGKVDQGVVEFWVAQHKLQKDLNYIGFGGTGKQVRDALHIEDACELIYRQYNQLSRVNGMIFNAGGGRHNAFSLKELTRLTQEVTGHRVAMKSVKQNRRADVRIYISDNRLVQEKTGWKPVKSVEDIIVDINAWLNKYIRVLPW